MKMSRCFLAMVISFLGIASPLSAQSAPLSLQDAPITKAGDWITRLRALYVYPNSSSNSLSTIPNATVSVNPCWTGELDVSYMFTEHLGSELILGASHNTVMGQGVIAGTKVGSTWLIAPALTLQWRFFPSSTVQPYVGAGANYTKFYSEHCDLANTSMSLSSSWGAVGQIGVDIFFNSHWFFNLDVKYMGMSTKATLTGGIPGTMNITINPLLFGVGIGYKW